MFLRNKNSYFAISAIAISFLAGILFFNYEKNNTPEAEAAAADNVMGFAWSENIGWISFNSTNCDPDGDNVTEGGINNVNFPQCPDGVVMNNFYGVNLNADNTLSGYAWSSNIGWISFQAADVAGCPAGICQPRLVSGTNFYGWARALANGGGWNGWISLNSENCDTDINNFIDVACGGDNATTPTINYNIILNGTDFEGWAWGGDVVGWLSFNHLNCDTNSDGVADVAGCVGATIPDYRVYIGNTSPIANNLQLFAPNNTELCGLVPDYNFQWDYNDTGAQSKFELQIDNDNDFSSPTVDRIVTSPPAIGNSNSQAVSLTPLSDAPGADKLSYQNTTYYWQVKVWDDLSADSGWVSGASFTTPAHLYPDADFTCPAPDAACAATYPLLSSIQFTDNSTCYDNSNNSIVCTVWNWNFGDGTPNSLLQNPLHQYTVAGASLLTFTVGDGLYSCPISKTINIGTSVSPKWKEVIPR